MLVSVADIKFSNRLPVSNWRFWKPISSSLVTCFVYYEKPSYFPKIRLVSIAYQISIERVFTQLIKILKDHIDIFLLNKRSSCTIHNQLQDH